MYELTVLFDLSELDGESDEVGSLSSVRESFRSRDHLVSFVLPEGR